MVGHMQDRDLATVQHPSTAPARLAEVAARRGDLHPLILAHPACYPQLREWSLRVNPAVRPMNAAVRPAMTTRPASGAGPVPHPRRGRGGSCALLGCGGVAVVIAAIVGIAVVGVLIAEPTGDRSTSQAQPNTQQPTGRKDSLAAFEAERTRYYELYAQLETNPVAPLVGDLLAFQRLETSIANPALTDARVATLAGDARAAREQLEQRIADAATRRDNGSGTTVEALVDEAGQGFIDVAWDAAVFHLPACRRGSHDRRMRLRGTARSPPGSRGPDR